MWILREAMHSLDNLLDSPILNQIGGSMKHLLGLLVTGFCLIGLTGCSLLPPLTPEEPTGPSSGNIGSLYAFTAVTTDPNEDPIAYRFNWGDGEVSDWSGFVPSGTPATMFHAWNSSGSYAVRAQAKDILGMRSCWSPGHDIVIRTQTGFPNSVIATIPIGGDPHDVDCHPSGEYVYVGNETVNEVIVIRTSDNTVVARVQVDRAPWRVDCHPNGEYVYVTHHGMGVTVIRTSDNTVVATIPIGGNDTDCGVFRPDGEYFYVGNDEPSNTVTVIRTSDNTIVATVPVGNDPRGITCLPDGSHIYTGNASSGTVSVVRTSDNTVVATVPVGSFPHRIFALPDGQHVYVAKGYSRPLLVIRTSNNTVVDSIWVGTGACGMNALPGGEYVYVANIDSDDVSVIRTSDNTVVATVPVGQGPWAVAPHPDGSRVYVINRYTRDVSVIGYR
ncbi:hypothetical protein CH330_10025 [candidate division WOR-3 bacterium JGI_Cruoil_03_51_56]|uniref:PKD domain-containing protein n=1 Tax=candidate division WOR-3 bacterium JGI_Cruoil_03_51_56 TaxID=1973747 RepID=A0A235BQ53_UNCW3|nr:MAG: hypothetical protein CH330_10025 [candidate division WOR-3 bacterium JGI_Cruoil_03_51_56]